MKTKHSAWMLAIAATVLASFALVPIAQAATPAKGYERFAGCPSPKENPAVEVCLHSVIKGGHFQMGNKDVPLSKPMSLTGGTNSSLEGFTANAQGGLTQVKQQVPGGLIGLTGLDWLVNFLNVEQLKLFAVTELVAPPTIGDALSLQIRVHLINPVLGSKCFVGTPPAPIKLNLIEGTTNPPPPNKPITGVAPEFNLNEATEVFSFKNGVDVDNSFAAPGANGCVLTLLGFIPISINGVINAASGLPSPAGTNETRQNIDIELAPVSRVYP